MICSRPVPCCPECEDTLIHQEYRGSGESSSGLGQYVNDKLDNVTYWLDIDGVIYSKKTKMLRVIEHKHPGQPLKESQQVVLGLIAKSLQLLATTRLIHHHSGVFVVRSEQPHMCALVERVNGWRQRKAVPRVELVDKSWRDFLTGEVVPLD
jgi:hypothetical protein